MAQASNEGAKVIPIAQARDRYTRRERTRSHQPSHEQLDLDGIAFERMTEEARTYFWFNVTNYARDLAQTATAYSHSEGERADGVITPYHIEAAEAQRMIRPAPRPRFGVGFALDAVQMVGAASCGALVARPGPTDGAGLIALAFALMVTVGTFLLRQSLPDSYTSSI